MSCHQNQYNYTIKILDMAEKYLGTKLTDHNYIHAEVRRRLNSGDTCCHSIKNVSHI